MASRKVAAGAVLILVVLAVVWLFSAFSDNPVKTAGVVNNPDEGNVIEITSSGFLPKELIISKGDTVTWVNKDTKDRWPASAMHPTHTVYPGVDYDAEGSYQGSLACSSKGLAKEGAFDSCQPLIPGESWSFTFDQVGTWNYHDHIVNGAYGKIIVNN